MKKTLTLLMLFPLFAFSQIAYRVGNTDRQKVDSLSYANDTLNIQITNDVLRKIKIPTSLGATSIVSVAAKDSVLTSSSDSLYIDYTSFQSAPNSPNRKLLRKNNGRLDLFPPQDIIPLNTVWRLRTGSTNDTISINPENGYTIVWEGKQGTENAVYITGEYESAYVEKVAIDTLLVSANTTTGFTYTPPPTGPSYGPDLITDGTFDSGTGWTLLNGSTISGGVATVVSNGNPGADFPNWSMTQYDITPTWEGVTFELQFDARQTVGSGNLRVHQRFGTIFNQTVTGTMTTYTVQFTGGAQTGQGHDLVFGGDVVSDEFEIDNVILRVVL